MELSEANPTSLLRQARQFTCALPPDLLLNVFSRLAVEDLVAAGLACRNCWLLTKNDSLWENLLRTAHDPETWEYVLFAETYLRQGPTKICRPSLKNGLPFRQIYMDRAKAPVSVILDGGSGYCKYGWSNCDLPDGRIPTFLEFGNIETPLASRLKQLFVTIFDCAQTRSTLQPIVVSEPLCNQDYTAEARSARRQLREVTFSVLFSLGVPAVCSVNQAVLALFAARQTSGIVVNFGFHVTTLTPILHGKVLRKVGVETVDQGAMRLTGHLAELMQNSGINFASMYTVREVKEMLCYVAQDYEQEGKKCTAASCTVGTEGEFTLRDERYQTPEILFQPLLGGLGVLGLHRAVAASMSRCADYKVDDPADAEWYKTIIMTGGTASFPGLPERLDKELKQCLPSDMYSGLNVVHPVRGLDAAWFGANMLCNLSTFEEAWCVTGSQFAQFGPSIAHALAQDDEPEVLA